MHPLLNVAITAAKNASDIIVRSLDRLEHIKPTTKGNEGYVSEVDLKAEQVIINTIHKLYPAHGIIAEESGHFQTDAETVWIIDPLDGTTNFLHGLPFYAISIAVKVKGQIEHGVIYDPIRHECFAASRGRGARLNNQRLRVSKCTHLKSALLGTGFPFRDDKLTQQYMPTFTSVSKHCHAIRRIGAAALELAYVAAGRLDGFWEIGLKPWDIAAGALLILEAGGLVTDLNEGSDYVETGNIIASNPKLYKPLYKAIHQI